MKNKFFLATALVAAKNNALCRIFFISAFLSAFLLMMQNANGEDSKFSFPQYSKTISMEFKNAELNDVLRILSNQSGLNFIASQDAATKRVTLFLKDVPVEEALERILAANDLTYELEAGSGIFIVKPLNKPSKELVTRIYLLKHATVESSKLNSTITISTDSSSESAGGASQVTASGAGIIDSLKAVLTESGKIVENARTNSLIITDIASQFPVIESTLARLDVPIPQILIEVEMLDISKRTADNLGVKYGDSPLTFSGAKRFHIYPWDLNNFFNKGGELEEENKLYETGTIDASGFTAVLQFLRSQTDTKNLARPRILTLNNQTAQIRISTDQAVGTKTSTDTGDSAATKTVEAERVQTGVFLTVTPQANLLLGEITLAIAPKVIEARDTSVNNIQFKDPEERGSQSLLRVYSGDTVIIGGLLRTDKATTITKVPLLGDIPVIGGAFRHKNDSHVERELVIFITPHILNDKGPMPKMKNAVSRMEREQSIPAYERDNEIERALTSIQGRR